MPGAEISHLGRLAGDGRRGQRAHGPSRCSGRLNRSHGAHPAAGSATIRTGEIARAFGLRGTYRGGRLYAPAYAWPATSVTPLAAAPPPAHRPAPARGCLSAA